jgi:small subunit ribosomal protein S16
MVEEDQVSIDADAAKKWIGNGAQPTDTVRALLKKQGII